jgi:hypothetical protein
MMISSPTTKYQNPRHWGWMSTMTDGTSTTRTLIGTTVATLLGLTLLLVLLRSLVSLTLGRLAYGLAFLPALRLAPLLSLGECPRWVSLLGEDGDCWLWAAFQYLQ